MRILSERNQPRFRRVGWGLLVVLVGILVIQGCTTTVQNSGKSEQTPVPGSGIPAQGTGGSEQKDAGTNGGELMPAPVIGRLAPGFTLVDLGGNQVTLSDFRGQTVCINFWATWCPPCRAEMPEIEAVHQEYKDKGVVVIGVDIMEAESDVRQFVERGGYSWTFVLDTIGAVANDYKITKLPTSFFIDREGIVRAMKIGAMTQRAMEVKLAEAMR